MEWQVGEEPGNGLAAKPIGRPPVRSRRGAQTFTLSRTHGWPSAMRTVHRLTARTRWALSRPAIYVLAAIASVLAFTLWVIIYTALLRPEAVKKESSQQVAARLGLAEGTGRARYWNSPALPARALQL